MVLSESAQRPGGTSDTLHAEVADALARGLVTPAEVAGLREAELLALLALGEQALVHAESKKAHTLAQTAVVLAPYTPAPWALLARTLRHNGQAHLAVYAEEALRLLTPKPQPIAALPSPETEPTSCDEVTRTLVLHDGRTLPLRTTPVAVHHDTAAARKNAKAPLGDADVAWATRTSTHTGDAPKPTSTPGPITKTSIVVRPKKDNVAPSHGALTHSGPVTQTSEIARPGPATAAKRRIDGWPMTDEHTLTSFASDTSWG